MFDIGFSELFMLAIIALVVLGPEKLPQAARMAGKWYTKIRFSISKVQTQIETEFNIAETRRQMEQEIEKVRNIEANMQQELEKMRQALEKSNGFEQSTNQTTAAIDPHSAAKHDDIDDNVTNASHGDYNNQHPEDEQFVGSLLSPEELAMMRQQLLEQQAIEEQSHKKQSLEKQSLEKQASDLNQSSIQESIKESIEPSHQSTTAIETEVATDVQSDNKKSAAGQPDDRA